MPEFEEPEAAPSSKQDYTPSVDASDKPRSRRRSGGFKTEHTVQNSSIGEVDPVEALKKEKLSGGSKPEPKARNEKPRKKEDRAKTGAPRSEAVNPQPSPETLEAIERVETRIAERRKERDARRAEKDKNRPAKNKNSAKPQKGSGKKPPSGGIVGSILSFFGLGPKQPAKKKGGQGKPSGNRGKGNRPRGKGGNRPQGQNRRGGKGRRSQGNGPGGNGRRSQDKKS